MFQVGFTQFMITETRGILNHQLLMDWRKSLPKSYKLTLC